VRHPDRVRGLILVGPTVDPAARTADYGAAEHLGPLVLAFLRRRVQAQDGKAG
jgi:pimeloyl-ACP methyl ester carboxylesterase